MHLFLPPHPTTGATCIMLNHTFYQKSRGICKVHNVPIRYIKDVEYVDCVQQYFSAGKQHRAYYSMCAEDVSETYDVTKLRKHSDVGCISCGTYCSGTFYHVSSETLCPQLHHYIGIKKFNIFLLFCSMLRYKTVHIYLLIHDR